MPSWVRKGLDKEADSSFALLRGFDRYILAFPLDEWKKYERRWYRELNYNIPLHRDFLERIYGDLSIVQMDKQGRIYIPKRLLDHAKIEREVFLFAILDKIEIWNPQVYEQLQTRRSKDISELAQEIFRPDGS